MDAKLAYFSHPEEYLFTIVVKLIFDTKKLQKEKKEFRSLACLFCHINDVGMIGIYQ